MAKAYNYTLAKTHRGKIYIPYIGIEVDGKGTIAVAFIGCITATAAIGFPLSFIVGSTGYFIGAIISVLVAVVAVTYANEVNNETGRTKLREIYYLNIKGYRYIYDKNGDKHFLQSKKRGVIFVNARR